MTRSVLVLPFLVVAACSGSSHPVATEKPAVAVRAPPALPAKPACTTPSRLCELVALADHGKLDELATVLYGDQGTVILAKLRARGLEALVVDPGVVLRLDELMAFPIEPGEGPWQVRARFSAKLGTVRIYRGLAVTPDELASISRTGILAASTRGTEPVPPVHLLDQLMGHLFGIAGPRDTMLSVSFDPVISRCVAAMFAGTTTTKAVHVWAADVPALDVLSIEAPSLLCPAVEPGTLDCTPRRELDQAARLYSCRNFYDPKVESFVQSRIDPPELVAVTPEPRTDDCTEVIQRVKKELRIKRTAQEPFCKPLPKHEAAPPPPGRVRKTDTP